MFSMRCVQNIRHLFPSKSEPIEPYPVPPACEKIAIHCYFSMEAQTKSRMRKASSVYVFLFIIFSTMLNGECKFARNYVLTFARWSVPFQGHLGGLWVAGRNVGGSVRKRRQNIVGLRHSRSRSDNYGLCCRHIAAVLLFGLLTI